jgi:hypothetical protein
MSETAGPASFGRVDADGTVYVRTADGERAVGQIPDATPEEALAFYVKRFEALEVEVGLLAQRISAGALSPEDARQAVNNARKSITDANAVGDLDSLIARLDAQTPIIAEQAEARRAARVEQQAAAREAKEAMVAEAEALAGGSDWRSGVNRFRDLLEQWKSLPRIDRATDDALWHRFSTARTTYTRRRKAQFAEHAARREEALRLKQQIIEEARELADSTSWGQTAGAFRELMARWKAAGPAPRQVDESLWNEFRGLQDQFFNARAEALAEQDSEFKENLEAKTALLDKAEADILPITDVAAARSAYRRFLEDYNQVGRVPRDSIRTLDNRLRALEASVRRAEEDEWKRTDPEARARAEDTVSMLSAEIAKLEEKIRKATARGDKQAVKKSEDAIATYRSWLEQAKETLADFTR